MVTWHLSTSNENKKEHLSRKMVQLELEQRMRKGSAFIATNLIACRIAARPYNLPEDAIGAFVLLKVTI